MCYVGYTPSVVDNDNAFRGCFEGQPEALESFMARSGAEKGLDTNRESSWNHARFRNYRTPDDTGSGKGKSTGRWRTTRPRTREE